MQPRKNKNTQHQTNTKKIACPNNIEEAITTDRNNQEFLPGSFKDKVAILIYAALSARKISREKTIFGPAPAAVSPCTCAASKNGSKISISSKINKIFTYSTGNAHSVIMNTINPCQNITATAVKI